MASQQAPQIAALVNLNGRRCLIDVGGGPGTYAIHFCKHNPDLNAMVFDLPTTRPFAEKCIEQHGLSRRIRFSEGNFLTAEIPGRDDVVWLSHILHAESPEDCHRLILKALEKKGETTSKVWPPKSAPTPAGTKPIQRSGD